MSGLYFNLPEYGRDFAPTPSREWTPDGGDAFICPLRAGTMRVFRFGDGKPWWAECDNPEFEAKAWFWTAEQAQHWCEKHVMEMVE